MTEMVEVCKAVSWGRWVKSRCSFCDWRMASSQWGMLSHSLLGGGIHIYIMLWMQEIKTGTENV